MKTIGIVLLIILLGVWFFTTTHQAKNDRNEAALIKPDLHITGVVESVKGGDYYNGYGIIRLKIISSNVQDYDPRGSLKYYFCVIKNGQAEIYDHASETNTFVGDTLIYDTKEMRATLIKNGQKVDEGDINVSSNDNYYRFIEQNTIFK